MKFYVDELPKSCWECPLNYDTIECNIYDKSWFEMEKSDLKEYKDCLDGKGRYSKCPLILLQNKQNKKSGN